MRGVNDNIQVSVICLAYNHERYIRRTLEGFVNQKTNFAFEVLINDDASIDDTSKIIREYEEKYPDIIKPVYQTVNQFSNGGKILQRFLYPKSKGKYFAWCEGDDYWSDEKKLQKQFDIMETHPECSICVHKVQCINEDGTVNERIIPEPYYKFHGGCLSDDSVADGLWNICNTGNYPFQTSAYFIRRNAILSLVEGTLPFAGYMNGDHALMRLALANGHFYYIDEVMSCYRLMSIGCYTSRFQNLSQEKKFEADVGHIAGNLIYDEYTEKRFHKWIVRRTANFLLSIGLCDIDIMKDLLTELKFKEIYVLIYAENRKSVFVYVLKYRFSRVYKIIKSLSRKNSLCKGA